MRRRHRRRYISSLASGSFRFAANRLGSAQLGLVGLDLTRRRLMAKLVLVLFKFKF